VCSIVYRVHGLAIQLVGKEVQYLGYVISDCGMAKIKAVKELPVPANLKQLRSFLGLAS